MPRFQRKDLMARFQKMKADRVPIIGGGAGTGLSAKCEEAGGIDLIVIYNSGRYRMAGRGSLSGMMAYGNANDVVVEMAREILPVVTKTPVLAGVNGTDPFCIFDHFLGHLKALGREARLCELVREGHREAVSVRVLPDGSVELVGHAPRGYGDSRGCDGPWIPSHSSAGVRR